MVCIHKFIYIIYIIFICNYMEREREIEREREKNMCPCIIPSLKKDKPSMHKDLEHRSVVDGLLFR